MQELKVCWISAGVSSFIAGCLKKDTIDKYIYIDIQDQHPDSIRFIKDCERVLGKDIEILKSSKYDSVQDAILSAGVIKMPRGFAPCTNYLKKRVRKEWEDRHSDYHITYVWGFDNTEKHRADNLVEAMPNFDHEFPLIDNQISKQDAHGMCNMLGIQRPEMYNLGYHNNNCIGCVKGGMGYWNKIRKDFPQVFKERAELERKIGHTILKDENGQVWLDELDENRGRIDNEIMEECGIFCMLNI